MTDKTIRTRPTHFALGLSGAHLVQLLDDPDLRSRLDKVNASFSIAGIDRIDGSTADGQTIDPSIAVTSLADQIPRAAFLVAAAPQRDHPFNLARRIGSLDHLTSGKTGVLFGTHDGYAPAGPAGREAWGGAGLSVGAPLGADTTRDAAIVAQKLWQSWPYDSIIADLKTRIFARGEKIVHIDHHGVFDVAGPLNLPSSPHGTPLVAWYARSLEEVRAAADSTDLVVLPGDPGFVAASTDALASVPSTRFGSEGKRALVFVEVKYSQDLGPDELAARVREVADQSGVAGVVLRPDSTAGSLRELIENVVPLLVADGLVGASVEGPLRTRLGLPDVAPLLERARPAFAAPEPQPAL